LGGRRRHFLLLGFVAATSPFRLSSELLKQKKEGEKIKEMANPSEFHA
jgi:hypothetical protein